MKNELSKQKKKVGRIFWGAAVFLQTLLFTILGLLFYILAPNIQLSPVTENRLLLVVLIFLFVAVFAWKFWYKPALTKYDEEYGSAKKLCSNLTFAVAICIIILISAGISFWCF